MPVGPSPRGVMLSAARPAIVEEGFVGFGVESPRQTGDNPAHWTDAMCIVAGHVHRKERLSC